MAGQPESRKETVTAEGRVLEALPHTLFAVELTDGRRILCRISGDIRTRGLRINPGDRVTLELSPYDQTRGRITRRHS